LAFTAVRLDLHAAARFERHSRWPPRYTRIPASLRLNSSKAGRSSMPPSCPSSLLQRHVDSLGPSLILFRRFYGRSHFHAVPASAQDSSLGVAKESPPSNYAPPVHSHQFPIPKDLSLVSVTTCQSCHSFRSCRSSRLQRFTPGCVSRACCIPQPIMGFTTFPVNFSRLQGKKPRRAVQFLWQPRSLIT